MRILKPVPSLDYVARKSRGQKETERLLASSPNLRGRFNLETAVELAVGAGLPAIERVQSRASPLLQVTSPLTRRVMRTGWMRISAHMRWCTRARRDLLELEAQGLLEKARQGNAFVSFAPADLRERLADLAKTRS